MLRLAGRLPRRAAPPRRDTGSQAAIWTGRSPAGLRHLPDARCRRDRRDRSPPGPVPAIERRPRRRRGLLEAGQRRRRPSSALSYEPMESGRPTAAFAQDWLTIEGGAERVALQLVGLMPRADIHTTF